MKVGSTGEPKVYLSGKQVLWTDQAGGFLLDDYVAAGVELNAGLNALVFKTVRGKAGWQGSVRFTDSAGNPTKGLRTSLTP
jgi:hypothetical protein